MTECFVNGTTVRHTGPGPYVARSASDRNPDWPIWYVADATGYNGVKIEGSLAKLFDRETAVKVADALNGAAR